MMKNLKKVKNNNKYNNNFLYLNYKYWIIIKYYVTNIYNMQRILINSILFVLLKNKLIKYYYLLQEKMRIKNHIFLKLF